MNDLQQHQFYCGVDLHARNMYVHVLDAKGKTRFDQDLPAEPDVFLDALKPFRKNVVVGCECMFAWYWLAFLASSSNSTPLALDWRPRREPVVVRRAFQPDFRRPKSGWKARRT